MARSNKITIRVVEARRTATVSWQGVGTSGQLILSQESGQVTNAPLPRTDTNAHYWADVLNQVLPHLT